jgi:hypothetical protein
MGYIGKKKKLNYLKNPIDLSYIKLKTDELDAWQKEVFAHAGSIAIRAGRQVGKSYIMAKKVAQFALANQGVKILVSASSERQAMYLYEKISFELKFCSEIDVYAETPTMRRSVLKNASEIYCLPTGLTGNLIRGLTLDVWVPDEAAYIPPQVYTSVTPMMWISQKERGMGWIWALSTPFGKQGKFYDMFNNPTFKTWHIKSTECARIPEEELTRWKKEFSRIDYAQEVLGEFIDEVSRLFPEDTLRACFKALTGNLFDKATKYLGVDVARFGGDENAFVGLKALSKKVRVDFAKTTERVSIAETYKKIVEFQITQSFNRILIDDGGVGGGLADFLIEKYRNKIVCLNNAQRMLDRDGEKKKTLLKEDMYSYALIRMENGEVEISEDLDNLYISLASMQFIYEGDKLKISGRDSHLAEAFVRAMWGAKSKTLKPFIRSF